MDTVVWDLTAHRAKASIPEWKLIKKACGSITLAASLDTLTRSSTPHSAKSPNDLKITGAPVGLT